MPSLFTYRRATAALLPLLAAGVLGVAWAGPALARPAASHAIVRHHAGVPAHLGARGGAIDPNGGPMHADCGLAIDPNGCPGPSGTAHPARPDGGTMRADCGPQGDPNGCTGAPATAGTGNPNGGTMTADCNPASDPNGCPGG